jgi:hypothetical protein
MAAGLKGEQAENWENQLRARVRLYSPGAFILLLPFVVNALVVLESSTPSVSLFGSR